MYVGIFFKSAPIDESTGFSDDCFFPCLRNQLRYLTIVCPWLLDPLTGKFDTRCVIFNCKVSAAIFFPPGFLFSKRDGRCCAFYHQGLRTAPSLQNARLNITLGFPEGALFCKGYVIWERYFIRKKSLARKVLARKAPGCLWSRSTMQTSMFGPRLLDLVRWSLSGFRPNFIG